MNIVQNEQHFYISLITLEYQQSTDPCPREHDDAGAGAQ